MLLGFYKDRLRLTPRGALAAIIGGGAAALISQIAGIKYLNLGALGVSAALLFLVSLADNRRGGRRLDGSREF